ncbi:porin [Limnohabitans sp.]|uniref:porin n=1 Tax=Limnohabitans sp. TaxID=1907725 RepID=UPI0038B84EC8
MQNEFDGATTLVALAALAATSAFAQSVTLYGIADVSYGTKTHTAGNGTVLGKTQGIQEGYQAGNRIGFRGMEDLGGGKSAGFVIENGINLTEGQLFSSRAAAGGLAIPDGGSISGNMPGRAYSSATNRQSFVSYADKALGEVRLGYQYTALYTVSTNSGYHLGSEQPGGDFAHGTLDQANYGGTRANGINYILPTFANTTVTLSKGAGASREVVDSSTVLTNSGKTADTQRRWSILAQYVNGPLNASYAHTDWTNNASATTAEAIGAATNIFAAASAEVKASAGAKNYQAKLDQFAGSYQLGSAKLTYSLANGKRDEVVGSTYTKSKAQQFGAEYALGAIRPFVISGTGKITNELGATTSDLKSSQWGVRYDLSKRTLAYIISGKAEDNAVASTASTLAKREGTAIGLFHSF